MFSSSTHEISIYFFTVRQLTLSPVSTLTKNFTALIPGTTVEILDQDSKNVIQLIIAAYNVSTECLVSCLCLCGREGE